MTSNCSIYVGDQIKQEYRGDLAVIIPRDPELQHSGPAILPECTGAYLCKHNPLQPLLMLAGIMKAERLYLGVSKPSSDLITREVAKNPTGTVFQAVDDLVLESRCEPAAELTIRG